jgi:phospholipase/carboxylesterase
VAVSSRCAQDDILTAVSGDVELLTHRIRPAAGAGQEGARPDGALVLFHGRGTNEFDLFGLLDELDPERRLVGVTPRAPFELSPGGFHWYVARQVGHPDPDTFRETLALASRWLDALLEALGVPWTRTILGGFSMGAVMSYALGLGSGRPAPAGVLALSGFLPRVDGWTLDTARLAAGYPVAIGHGTEDPVISIEFGRQARRVLEDAGARVTYRESPMFHSVDPAFLRDLRPWVREVLGPGRTAPPPG